jgi:hypothetical protein
VNISPSLPTGSQPGSGGSWSYSFQPRKGKVRLPDMIARRAGIVGIPSG